MKANVQSSRPVPEEIRRSYPTSLTQHNDLLRSFRASQKTVAVSNPPLKIRLRL